MRFTLLSDPSATSTAAATGVASGFLLFSLVVAVFYVACLWVIFTKAGKPGWAAIIPIYSTIVLLNISGHSGWWFLLLCIPFVNFIVLIIVLNDLSKAFGHGGGFTLGLLFLSFIFIPILAFGGSRYVGLPAQQMVAYAR